jgi:hypothetical protein
VVEVTYLGSIEPIFYACHRMDVGVIDWFSLYETLSNAFHRKNVVVND